VFGESIDKNLIVLTFFPKNHTFATHLSIITIHPQRFYITFYLQFIMSKQKQNENLGEIPPNKQPLFRKINYILIGVGVLFLALGFILIAGGGSDDPEVFNPAIFDKQRLVVAPILMLIGLIIEIVAIMYRAKK
jgi:hypothetical protein